MPHYRQFIGSMMGSFLNTCDIFLETCDQAKPSYQTVVDLTGQIL